MPGQINPDMRWSASSTLLGGASSGAFWASKLFNCSRIGTFSYIIWRLRACYHNIQINEEAIRDHLGKLVRSTVEETLNGMLDAEANQPVVAGWDLIPVARTG